MNVYISRNISAAIKEREMIFAFINNSDFNILWLKKINNIFKKFHFL